MKKQLTYSAATVIVALGFSTIGQLMSTKQVSWTLISDHSFLIGLLFLIIGTTILVLSSGFFDLFQKNMKQLIRLRRNNEPKDFVPLSHIFQKHPTYWFIVGITLVVISFLTSFIA